MPLNKVCLRPQNGSRLKPPNQSTTTAVKGLLCFVPGKGQSECCTRVYASKSEGILRDQQLCHRRLIWAMWKCEHSTEADRPVYSSWHSGLEEQMMAICAIAGAAVKAERSRCTLKSNLLCCVDKCAECQGISPFNALQGNILLIDGIMEAQQSSTDRICN